MSSREDATNAGDPAAPRAQEPPSSRPRIRGRQVVALTKRWSHHTEGGGYDRLGDALRVRRVARCESNSIAYKAINQGWERFSNHGLGAVAYRSSDWLAEWRVLLSCIAGNTRLVHALYGEEQLNLLLDRRRQLRAKLLATFHLPVERFERMPSRWRQRLACLDGAVCVSRQQIPAIAEAIGGKPVEFIPHGIDTQTFTPATARKGRERLNLLCVGSHLRDFGVLRSAAEISRNERLPVDFTLICPRRDQGNLHASGINTMADVSENDLIGHYRNADALFLPLQNATANNSLLEGLACGLPALVSDFPGVRDYVDEKAAVFIQPGNNDDVFDRVRWLCNNREELESRRAPARDVSLRFDWARIADEVHAFYRKL